MLVAQTIQASQPKRGFRIGRVHTVDLSVLLDCLACNLRLAHSGAQITEAAKVNSGQKAPGRGVIWVALEDFLGFGDSIARALGFPIHLGQALAYYRGFGVESVGLFVEIDRL